MLTGRGRVQASRHEGAAMPCDPALVATRRDTERYRYDGQDSARCMNVELAMLTRSVAVVTASDRHRSVGQLWCRSLGKRSCPRSHVCVLVCARMCRIVCCILAQVRLRLSLSVAFLSRPCDRAGLGAITANFSWFVATFDVWPRLCPSLCGWGAAAGRLALYYCLPSLSGVLSFMMFVWIAGDSSGG